MESDKTNVYEQHYESQALIHANAPEIFSYIDDHTNMASHMNKPSWMMGGSRMFTSFDAGHGQEIGSHIRMNGKVFGITLFFDEIVTHREPPRVKVWETAGNLRLLVIGHYRMKVKIKPQENASLLCVSIDYNLPTTNAWLGKLFGKSYAKWCVQQMINGVRSFFTNKENNR